MSAVQLLTPEASEPKSAPFQPTMNRTVEKIEKIEVSSVCGCACFEHTRLNDRLFKTSCLKISCCLVTLECLPYEKEPKICQVFCK